MAFKAAGPDTLYIDIDIIELQRLRSQFALVCMLSAKCNMFGYFTQKVFYKRKKHNISKTLT